MMTARSTTASVFLLAALAAAPARADVQINTISVPAVISTPLGGFTVNYTLTGSKFGVGAATAQLTFFLSATPDGSSGGVVLATRQLLLNGSGLGPYFPPPTLQSDFISGLVMPPNTVAALETITAACQPQTWFILARVDATPLRSAPSALGSVKLPDFFFTTGTISPTVIQPGGTTNISFNLATACPVNRPSRVGVFLADAAFNLLGFIGPVGVPAGAGPFPLPPTPIAFSPTIAPGSYSLVLIADVDGVVAESNENNNAGAFALQIVAPAAAKAGAPSGPLAPGVNLRATADQIGELERQPVDDYVVDSGFEAP